MQLHRRRPVQVGGRVEIRGQRGCRGFYGGRLEHPALQRRRGRPGQDRAVPHAEADQPRSRDHAVAGNGEMQREPGHRIVARPPRDLGNRAAVVRAGAGQLDRRDDLALAQRRLQQAGEEVARRHTPLPPARDEHHRGVQRHDAGRQLGGGIGIGQAAADRAAVADRRMGDQRRGLGQQRRMPGDQRIAAELRMPGQRPDAQRAARDGDAPQRRDARDVDQQLRFR
jgi:hypothetical protein